MRGRPGFVGGDAPLCQRERQQRRAGERRHRMQRAEPPRIARNGGAGGGERGFGLSHMDDAFGEQQARAKNVARPFDDRIPMARLTLDEAARRAGAVTNKIGCQISRHLLGDRSGTLAHAVDDRIGKPRQRHLGGIDQIALRLPLGGQRLRQSERRRGEQPARWRAHRLVVEPHGVKRPLRCRRGALIEPLAQNGASPSARRFHGIVRCGILEKIAHATLRPLKKLGAEVSCCIATAAPKLQLPIYSGI